MASGVASGVASAGSAVGAVVRVGITVGAGGSERQRTVSNVGAVVVVDVDKFIRRLSLSGVWPAEFRNV